jgi:hypothetical protein
MLQRGIETPDMDVRWVSSLSWYFLNFFGLNGLYRIILGNDNSADSSRDMIASPFANMGGGAPGQPQDFVKLFKAEKDNLAFAEGLYSGWVLMWRSEFCVDTVKFERDIQNLVHVVAGVYIECKQETTG